MSDVGRRWSKQISASLTNTWTTTKRGKKKKDYANLQDASVWRQVRSLPKTTESSVSVQQPLVDLARNGSCHNPCSVILFCPRMEIMEFLRFHIYSRHLAIQT